jgi:hypothetical protein
MTNVTTKGFLPRDVLTVMWLSLISLLIIVQIKDEISRNDVVFIAWAGGALLAITIEYCRLYFSLTLCSAATAVNSVDMPKLRAFDSCYVFGFVAFSYLLTFAIMYAKSNPNATYTWSCVGCVIVLYLLYRRVYKIYKATLLNDSAK